MANICVRYSERGRNHKSPIMKPTTVEIKDILIAELMRADDSLKTKTVKETENKTTMQRSSGDRRHISATVFLPSNCFLPCFPYSCSETINGTQTNKTV